MGTAGLGGHGQSSVLRNVIRQAQDDEPTEGTTVMRTGQTARRPMSCVGAADTGPCDHEAHRRCSGKPQAGKTVPAVEHKSSDAQLRSVSGWRWLIAFRAAKAGDGKLVTSLTTDRPKPPSETALATGHTPWKNPGDMQDRSRKAIVVAEMAWKIHPSRLTVFPEPASGEAGPRRLRWSACRGARALWPPSATGRFR